MHYKVKVNATLVRVVTSLINEVHNVLCTSKDARKIHTLFTNVLNAQLACVVFCLSVHHKVAKSLTSYTDFVTAVNAKAKFNTFAYSSQVFYANQKRKKSAKKFADIRYALYCVMTLFYNALSQYVARHNDDDVQLFDCVLSEKNRLQKLAYSNALYNKLSASTRKKVHAIARATSK